MKALQSSLAALLLASCAQLRIGPAPTYTNPLIDADFPDPAVLRAPDGLFYAYATQGERDGRPINVQVARSADLVTWTHLGDALPAKPAWARGKQAFWAPHVLYDAQAKRYFLYYSAEPDDARGKCLAVATAAAPAGPFTDSGAPLLCGSGIENIDPMAFDDPRTGRRLLYWGSGGLPLKVRELAADRLRFAPGAPEIEVLTPDAGAPYESLIEGAWVTYHEGLYYLFYSGDRCCAREPRYAVMVARAPDATGPFVKLPGAILERSDAWLAPGHNSVIEDDQGTLWALYHAIDTTRRERGRLMLLDPVEWRQGVPRIGSGRPTSGATPAPVVENAR